MRWIREASMGLLVSVVMCHGAWAETVAADSSAPVGVEQPEQLCAAIMAAVKSGDEPGVQRLCTEGYWNAESDPGSGIYRQASRKKLEFKHISLQVKPARAVVTAGVYTPRQPDKMVDKVFFYLEKKGSRWLLTATNETEAMVEHFLAGRIGARAELKSFPSSAELTALAPRIVSLLEGLPEVAEWMGMDDAQKSALWKGVLVGDPNPIFGNLTTLKAWGKAGDGPLEIIANHYVDSLSRGAVILRISEDQQPMLVLEKSPNGWRLLDLALWASLDRLLKD